MKSLDEILTAPVDALVYPDAQVRLSGADVRDWGLSDRDRWSMTVVGLPLIEVSEFIPEPEPGGLRRLRDHEGYFLGVLGRLDACLLPGSWQVIGVPNDLDRYEVPHPALQDVGLINSSPAAYVECSWRYYWLQLEWGDRPTTPDFFDVMDAFLAQLVEIDPAVGTDSSTSFWPATVENV